MSQEEIESFRQAIQTVADGNYQDGIDQFRQLIKKFPRSELVDDAEYNISLCFYQMNQFEKAISTLDILIKNHPKDTIAVFKGGNEFGRSAAKAYYLMVNCLLGIGQIDNARNILPHLEQYPDSYIVNDGKKVSFHQLAINAIELYHSLTPR
jgi:TolA-binding protein